MSFFWSTRCTWGTIKKVKSKLHKSALAFCLLRKACYAFLGRRFIFVHFWKGVLLAQVKGFRWSPLWVFTLWHPLIGGHPSSHQLRTYSNLTFLWILVGFYRLTHKKNNIYSFWSKFLYSGPLKLPSYIISTFKKKYRSQQSTAFEELLVCLSTANELIFMKLLEDSMHSFGESFCTGGTYDRWAAVTDRYKWGEIIL